MGQWHPCYQQCALALKKHLFSSPAAFASTLAKHEETLKSARKRKGETTPSVSVLRRQIADLQEDYADDHEAEEATQSTVDSATRLFRAASEEEAQLLKALHVWANRAAVGPDTKARMLFDWLVIGQVIYFAYSRFHSKLRAKRM